MTSDRKTGNDPESTFSFAVPELRLAGITQKLSVVAAPSKAANEQRGFDPLF